MARRYEFNVLVVRAITHSFAALTREILFLPLENKIHIFSPPCNILYVSTKSVRESEEISYISLESSKNSFPKFIHKSSLHRVVSTKSSRDSEKISYISLEYSKSLFRKIQYGFTRLFRFVSQNTLSPTVETR